MIPVRKVLITGGSGLVGQSLCKILQEKGYEVAVLTRAKNEGGRLAAFHWNPEKGHIDEKAFERVDFIVHLAGVNIGGGRWTAKRKQQIIDSRVKSGELVFRYVKKLDRKPHAFITASAIGYYGARTTEEIYSESFPPFDDFLGQTCSRWEQTADLFAGIGIRTVKIRTGIVLSEHGGMLSRITPLFRSGLGASLGSGKQYLPWIHMEDLCFIYLHAMENETLTDACNAAAPEHVTFGEFAVKLARSMNRRIWMPRIPAVLLRIALGNMSSMLLYGSRVSSERIRASGYEFIFPDLESAIKEIFP